MKKCFGFILLILLGGFLLAADRPKLEPLPVPLSNNAVASVKSRGSLLLYSMMGMGPKKTWDAASNSAYMLDPDADTPKWVGVRSVPGTVGRLAATAVGVREHIFLFGGYVVDAQGGETTLPDVNTYEPLTDRWFRAEDMPVAVDDSVAGAYRDRYIYVVSGWSKTDAVHDVQVYDAEKNKWSQATPTPGTPVFGTARYRIAAGGSEKDEKIYFSGGTDNPYDYNGVGYNGAPAEPSPVTFAFNVRTSKWETINEHTPQPTMDHRGLLVLPEGLVIVGGMEKGQQVTSRVVVLPKPGKVK
jgi:hypothetical protein